MSQDGQGHSLDDDPKQASAEESKTEIVEDLHSLLAGLDVRSDTLVDQVHELEQEHGGAVYSELIYLLCHLRFRASEAKPHWKLILEHRESMKKRLGSPVDLRVALVSYFVEVNRQLRNPKIIEMQLFERERASAYRDELTGLYNYRLFREHLAREMFRARRCGNPLSLVMIDIDNFKKYNDRNGHEEGNRALATVAKLLTQSLRKSDIPARYGGEEFVLILPSTPKTSAELVAERARGAVEQHHFPNEEILPGGALTVSLGVATFSADASEASDLVQHADRALYVAKAGGKNQVILYGQSRRSYGRVCVSLPGTFRALEQGLQPLTTINLSEAGVLFRTNDEIGIGTLIELTVQADQNRQFTASGRVVHAERGKDGECRTAVQFIDAGNADRSCLMKLVRDSAADASSPVAEPSSLDSVV